MQLAYDFVLDALTAPPEKGFFARLRERGKGAQE